MAKKRGLSTTTTLHRPSADSSAPQHSGGPDGATAQAGGSAARDAGTTTTTSTSRSGRRSAVNALAALAETAVAGQAELKVAAIAEHPANPRESVGDVTGLAASLRSVGVLQPLVVLTREVFSRSEPEHAAQLGDQVTHVVIAGHRRRAAAVEAGLVTVPVVVRDDLDSAPDAYVGMLAENLHRLDLTPIAEARGLAQLRDAGLKQQQIAERVGISQGAVSKRLALLKLPDEAQAAVTAGDLPVAAATKLAASPDPRRAWQLTHDAPYGRLEDAVTHAINRLDREEREAHQLAERISTLRETGLSVVDPDDTQETHTGWMELTYYNDRDLTGEPWFAGAVRDQRIVVAEPPQDPWDTVNVLVDPEVLPEQQKNTNQSAQSAQSTGQHSSGTPSDYEALAAERQKRTRAATKARDPFLRQLIEHPPASLTRQVDHLAWAVTVGQVEVGRSLQWLHRRFAVSETQPQGRGEPTDNPYDWRDSLTSPADRRWLAWAMVLASTEFRTRGCYEYRASFACTPGDGVGPYLRELVNLGYEPNDQEATALSEYSDGIFGAAAAAAETRSPGDNGDTAQDDEAAK